MKTTVAEVERIERKRERYQVSRRGNCIFASLPHKELCCALCGHAFLESKKLYIIKADAILAAPRLLQARHLRPRDAALRIEAVRAMRYQDTLVCRSCAMRHALVRTRADSKNYKPRKRNAAGHFVHE